jgi:serine/threonine protein kinase/tetratricopeptide (TPR) repeat protein
MLGPYKLLEQIGEGGMGIVWMAEQTEPIQRRVAVKVVKEGMDSRQVLARFEAERQALALMEHPNIAKVLDAGQTPSGRPYFVMELVKGQPITKYCDEKRLAVRERLELYADVCRAVQHAHQKGIIHRDLKPSNVLVAPYDGRPVVKVIDFGVAKATGQRLTDKTLFTGFGALVGTPEYMSPEQAEVNNQDIDTRSDIYALGVLLYELLTGSTPLTRKRLKEMPLLDVLRLIREEEPPRPSTRLLESKDTLPSISAQRQTEPAKLTRLVRGELDWIVMKALEKDRNRRYETANGFAMDVQRYLADEPVLACPPSASYRLKKFLRRHKGPVLAASAIVLLLAVLAGSIGWVVRDAAARRAETVRLVKSALKESATWQEQRRLLEALSAARRAEGLLAGADVEEALRQRVQARLADLELVDRLENVRLEIMTATKDGNFDSQGADDLYRRTFRGGGLDVEALSVKEAGQRIGASTVAAELAAVLDQWAFVRRDSRSVDDSSWKDLLRIARVADPDVWRTRVREALERSDRQTLLSLASSEEVFKLAPATLFVLGNALRREKQSHTQTEVFLREAQRRHPNDFWLNINLGDFFDNMQPRQVEEAVRFYAVATALRPDSSTVHNNFALVLAARGRLDEAAAECQEALRIMEENAYAHNNLGNVLYLKGLLDESIAEWHEAIRLKEDYAEPHRNLGRALGEKGQFDDAITECRLAIRIKKDWAEAHGSLGNALHGKGLLDEAIFEYRQAIQIKKDHAEAHCNLGGALAEKGQFDDAIAECRHSLRLNKHNAQTHYNLGVALAGKGQFDDAIAAYRQAIRLKKDYAEAHNNLGNVLAGKGQFDDAIFEYRQAIQIKKDYAEAHNNLGNALVGKGLLDDAIAAYRQATRLRKEYAEAHFNLGNALRQKGQFRESAEEFRRGHEFASRNPGWHHPSDKWLREAERTARLDDRLSAVLAGKDQPRDAAECLGFAELCQLHRQRYAAAVKFFEQAFDVERKLAEDLRAGHRYNAACAAALAGSGQGKDADKLNAKERARLRAKALDWLRADLDAWGRLLNKQPDMARPVVVEQMRHWQADTDFSGVRGPQALSQLPEAERKLWQRLWDDVANTLARAQGKTTPDKKSGAK